MFYMWNEYISEIFLSIWDVEISWEFLIKLFSLFFFHFYNI